MRLIYLFALYGTNYNFLIKSQILICCLYGNVRNLRNWPKFFSSLVVLRRWQSCYADDPTILFIDYNMNKNS